MNKGFKKAICALLVPVFLFSSAFVYAPQARADGFKKPCWNNGALDDASGGIEGFLASLGLLTPWMKEFLGLEPVNLLTGAFAYKHQDINIPGRGPALELTRYYDSQDTTYEGPFGRGWSHNYDISLKVVSDNGVKSVIKRNPDSTKEKFHKNSDGTYSADTPGCYDVLAEYPTALPGPLINLGLSVGLNAGLTLTKKDGTVYLFDLAGALFAVRDANGNALTFTHFDPKRIKDITASGNRKLTFAYNAQHKVSTITDSSGRVFTYAYSAAGDLASVTTPAVPGYTSGLTTTYAYDSEHRITSIVDAKGVTYLANTYDTNARVTNQSYGSFSGTISYASNKTILTDFNGAKTDYNFNADGTLASKVEYLSDGAYITSLQYDANKNITQIIYPKGNSRIFTYDSRGNVLTAANHPAGGADITTTFTYEPVFNKVKTTTDPLGRVTTFNYDANGNLTGVVYPQVGGATPQISFTYNTYGEPLTMTDPKGMVTALVYDANGYVTSVTADPAGINAQTGFTYDARGNVLSVTDPLNHATSFSYDSLNRLTGVTGPTGLTVKYSYDANSNLIKLEKQADAGATQWQTSEYGYNALDQLTQVKQYLSATLALTTSFTYDAKGNKTGATDPEGRFTAYAYDERGQLAKVTDANSAATEYAYDPNGNLAAITDAKDNVTSYSYDGYDRLTQTTYPGSSYEAFTYDSNSNLLTKRTRKGDTISYAYDALNRLTKKSYPNSTAVNYAYDVASRLTSVTNPNSALAYNYDALNRVTQVTDTRTGLPTQTIGYQYDKLNKTRLTYPDSTYLTFDYDTLNRLTLLRQGSGGQATTDVAAYTYDTLSRRLTTSLGNGKSATYSYDNLNRLLSLNNGITPMSYSYDKVGNRLSKTTAAGTEAYGYDAIYQLTQVTDPASQVTSYNYDKLGNRVTADGKSYTSNSLNQITQIDANALTYDGNGNLQGHDGWVYGYDYENRLISATNGTTTASYGYDGFGRRTSKTVNGTTTNYLNDGANTIAEYSSSGSLQKKYVFSQGIDEPLMMIVGANKYYYHQDGLGSTSEVSDNAGNIIEKYKYGVYGAVFVYDNNDQPLTASSIGNEFLFTGHQYDPETSLYYNRARHYSPTLGRFLQTDPAGYLDDINLYKSVRNNPLNYIDPFGEDTYRINNEFGKSTPTDSYVSHTFIAITDKNPVTGKQKVTKTYSWVNTDGGKWEQNDPVKEHQNMEGAQSAIDLNKGATKVGGESLDNVVDDLFNERKDKEKGGFWPGDGKAYRGNCKAQADRLISDAIKQRAINKATKGGMR